MNGIVAPQCPRCSGELLPMVWGMPTVEAWEAGERGEVYIGGCIMPPGPVPRWRCADCGSGFTAEGTDLGIDDDGAGATDRA